MVRRSYPGIVDPEAAFEALRPYMQELARLQFRCRPFSPEYLVLAEAMAALSRAANHFNKHERFYNRHSSPLGHRS